MSLRLNLRAATPPVRKSCENLPTSMTTLQLILFRLQNLHAGILDSYLYKEYKSGIGTRRVGGSAP